MAKYQVLLVESVKRSLIFEAKTEKELKGFIEGRDYSTRILIDRYKYHSHSKTPYFDRTAPSDEVIFLRNLLPVILITKSNCVQ